MIVMMMMMTMKVELRMTRLIEDFQSLADFCKVVVNSENLTTKVISHA